MQQGSLRDTAFEAARARHDYPWKAGLVGLGVAGLGAAAGMLGWEYAPIVSATGGTVLTGTTGWWWVRHVARPGTSKTTLARVNARRQRAGGTATRLDVWQYASPQAMRLQAKVIRPSLRELSRRQLRKVPQGQYCIELVHTGYGWFPGERVAASYEDTTLLVGGPRSGKTGLLACIARDAPGALVTTSTRSDLAEWVHEVRSRDGRAVHVWNPSGYVDIPSTVRWSVLTGCQDYTTALRRATALLPETGDGEHAYWVGRTRPVLALLMHAAALAGKRMADIQRWITEEPDGDGRTRAEIEVVEAVMTAGPGGPLRAAQARQFWGLADRTRKSIVLTMGPALEWLSNDLARELGDSPLGPDSTTLDIPRMIRERETLHILGHEDQTGLGPLNACLVDEIAHQARVISGTMPEDRLDPPLMLCLDELALVCPIPLDRLAADFGGRGVSIIASIQSLAQLKQVWSETKAASIRGLMNNLVVFGGGANAEELRELSILTGAARYENIGEDHDAADSHRWAPVLDEAQIRELGRFQALVLRRGIPPVVGWITPVWDREEEAEPRNWWERLVGRTVRPRRVHLAALVEQLKATGAQAPATDVASMHEVVE